MYNLASKQSDQDDADLGWYLCIVKIRDAHYTLHAAIKHQTNKNANARVAI